MRPWWIVVALVACNKRQDPPPVAPGSAAVTPADAQPADMADGQTRSGKARVRLVWVTGERTRLDEASRSAARAHRSRRRTRSSDEGSDDPTQFLVGSPYGGLKGDVVAEILRSDAWRPAAMDNLRIYSRALSPAEIFVVFALR